MYNHCCILKKLWHVEVLSLSCKFLAATVRVEFKKYICCLLFELICYIKVSLPYKQRALIIYDNIGMSLI